MSYILSPVRGQKLAENHFNQYRELTDTHHPYVKAKSKNMYDQYITSLYRYRLVKLVPLLALTK